MTTNKQEVSNNSGAEGRSKAIALRDMEIGASVIGYVKDLFKVSTSKTPDVENIALIQKDGTELVVWASGTLRYFRERMTQKGADLGTLCKITRVERPANAKSKDQKYFAEIGFNLSDKKSVEEMGEGSGRNGKGRTDADGFEF